MRINIGTGYPFFIENSLDSVGSLTMLVFCEAKFELHNTSNILSGEKASMQIYEQVHRTKAKGKPDTAPSKHLPSEVVSIYMFAS